MGLLSHSCSTTRCDGEELKSAPLVAAAAPSCSHAQPRQGNTDEWMQGTMAATIQVIGHDGFHVTHAQQQQTDRAEQRTRGESPRRIDALARLRLRLRGRERKREKGKPTKSLCACGSHSDSRDGTKRRGMQMQRRENARKDRKIEGKEKEKKAQIR